ncbi:hypothetical protein [Capnocytophaga sputigena]|jgi:hypothetical protein|uniref:hypothetical protein n=1 Tax=Capnocytophaga sputigena TaxID=1019 RepID=UPI0028D48276|nr:hypothetical protein [Capnocytophaga sputigena]
MKEALEHDLITLATEILANEGEWNLAQLNKQAHKITEKITILTFVEKYYQTLGASEDRMYRTMRKVSDFIDDNRQEDLFDIEVEASEVQPITAPKTAAKETPKEEPATFVAMEPAPITKEEKTAPAEKPTPAEKPVAKKTLKEEQYPEPHWALPVNRSKTEEVAVPVEKVEEVRKVEVVEKPKPKETPAVAFEIEQPAIEQPTIEQPTIEKPEIDESELSKSAIKQLADFIQQPEYTDEERILKQTPSLEEFISQSKHTVFDKKDADEEVKPAQSLNDKFGKTAQIGLNDKLAFVQKLFFGSESEYNKVVKHIADLHSMQDAVIYIEQEVKPTYNYWKGKEEYEQRFLDLTLKRFEV